MSWILGIDTSSSSLSIGLCDIEGNAILAHNRYVKNSHSEHIAQIIADFFRQLQITARDISHCAVVTGPGSFTGLRIGISFLKGLFANSETQILPVSSLENMAFSYPLKSKQIVSIIDARQEMVFFGRYRNNVLFERVQDDEKISIDSLIPTLSTDTIVLYDTAGNMRSSLPEILDRFTAIPFSEMNLSTGLAAAKYAAQNIDSSEWTTSINTFPNYMQESYAERVKKQ